MLFSCITISIIKSYNRSYQLEILNLTLLTYQQVIHSYWHLIYLKLLKNKNKSIKISDDYTHWMEWMKTNNITTYNYILLDII